MGLTVKLQDGVVFAAGEMSLTEAALLERELVSAIEAAASAAAPAAPAGLRRTVTLDMAQVAFIDSTGLSVLVRVKQMADAHGIELVLRAPQPQARRLLELTGLAERLTISEPISDEPTTGPPTDANQAVGDPAAD